MPLLPAPPLPDWITRQLPPLDRYAVDVGGQRMHVMEAGVGQPVLLAHGNPTWGFLYRKVIRALDLTRFRVIVPDLVGLGLSSKPSDARSHSLEAHIAWMGRLLDALALRDLIVAGQDWGGPIAFGAAARRRDRVRGLVVMNTVISPPKVGARPTAFHRFARLPLVSDVAFRLLGFPQLSMNLAQGDRRSIPPAAAAAYWWPLRDPRDNLATLALARIVPDGSDHPSNPALARVHAFVKGFRGPAAIVWGDRDPVLGSVRGWVERNLPDAPVTRTRAGHFLQEEVPEDIARAIADVADRG
ncbi:MAG: haloalkane dehalogenase [Deltaproteobacteria bacterium HGW-Deltaproteobacteria-14]|jgi:haloalkane dehalogenase|nr:MAG: haloalkane dehalogenase [Deltaproteobacteria bacterium HGW-Deltaproteobacteria-14]